MAVVGAHGHDELARYYVWDRLVRATHWVIALSIAVLAVTGFYLGHPFLSTPGEARAHFTTGWAKVFHFYAAIAFSLAVGARLVWMVRGPRHSGWRNFMPVSRRRWRDLGKTLQFYLLIRRTPPTTIGHNPLAGLSYLAVFGMYLVMIATGLALYAVSSHSYMHHFAFLVRAFHGVQWTRWIHHLTMWGIIAFAVAHTFFAMLTSRNEKNGELDSIFSGYKFLPKDQPPDDKDV
ncbi:MAG TPA: Ni/Fe-hydrogenase, b-type cytochrome subunit [Kofleriaceae bacterium]|nr:Ni/Fe-hydrogenase, b-type cytochrome subunit [Kofleriaceae bacterium]